MRGGVSWHSLQAHGSIDQLLDPVIPVVHLLQFRTDLQSFLQGDMQGHGRHQFCHHVSFRIAEIQSTTHIPDSASGSHSTKSSNLGNAIFTIFSGYVVNNFPSALLAEVSIKVGHAHPFRIQKALKNQGVLHGIHFCNMHTVRHNGCRAGSSARSYRNAHFLGIANKVPNNEVIVHIPHTAYDINLIFQAIHIFLRRITISLLKAFITELSEILLIGITFRHRERR